MDTKRIEALSDGVFAIAMTILVLEVHVPELPRPLGRGDLWHALLHLAPSILAYGISFIILGTLWIGQHNQHHFLRRVDRPLLWLNVFYLSFISFLPFGTALLAKYHQEPLASVVYGGTLLLSGVAVYSGAVALSFVKPFLGLALFALMPVVYILPGRIDLHLKRDHPSGA